MGLPKGCGCNRECGCGAAVCTWCDLRRTEATGGFGREAGASEVRDCPSETGEAYSTKRHVLRLPCGEIDRAWIGEGEIRHVDIYGVRGTGKAGVAAIANHKGGIGSDRKRKCRLTAEVSAGVGCSDACHGTGVWHPTVIEKAYRPRGICELMY